MKSIKQIMKITFLSILIALIFVSCGDDKKEMQDNSQAVTVTVATPSLRKWKN